MQAIHLGNQQALNAAYLIRTTARSSHKVVDQRARCLDENKATVQRPNKGSCNALQVSPDTYVGWRRAREISHAGKPTHTQLRNQAAHTADAQGEDASCTAIRPEKGVIIKELNHLAGSHGKGSTTSQ